jgi:hypothetical protein
MNTIHVHMFNYPCNPPAAANLQTAKPPISPTANPMSGKVPILSILLAVIPASLLPFGNCRQRAQFACCICATIYGSRLKPGPMLCNASATLEIYQIQSFCPSFAKSCRQKDPLGPIALPLIGTQVLHSVLLYCTLRNPSPGPAKVACRL